MIEAREKIIGYCEALIEKVREASVSGDTAEKIAAIANSARERQLVVPIVGAFSAGKSTLINNLLGGSILPVDVRPETSLATELRYSPDNFILAVKDNGETDRYQVEEIKTVTANAAKYLYAQLYLNNEKLREIEPLVLVDMPGFDSPLDLHNKAIMAYLDRGCYYVILSSAEEGTVTKSLERRLNEIDGFGRDFSFFLSKANLRSEDTVNELVTYYQKQLTDKYGNETKVVPFGQSADEVTKCLKSIEVNKVFLKIYKDTLLVICNDIIANINLQINSSKKDAEKLRSAIAEMGNSIEKLRKKAANDIDDMRRRYSGTFINEIISDVSSALEGSLDELVEKAISGNQEAISRCISEIVRSALASSIREKLDGINRQITIDFSESLQDLDKIMKSLDLDENYLTNITGKVEDAIKIAGTLFTDTELTENKGAASGGSAKAALAGIGAVAAKPATAIAAKVLGAGSFAVPFIGPVISILILFLPEIVSGLAKLFGGGDQKEKQKEAIRSKFSGEIFPSIKRKIRDEIPAELGTQITLMIQNVKEQFEVQIKNQEEAVNMQIAQENTNVEEKKAVQQKLETVRSDVQNITNQIMTWGK
jgi:GTPase SAR1 family protein